MRSERKNGGGGGVPSLNPKHLGEALGWCFFFGGDRVWGGGAERFGVGKRGERLKRKGGVLNFVGRVPSWGENATKGDYESKCS